MMRGTAPGVTLVMALVAGQALAADDAAQERSRIAAERTAAHQRFEAARRDCEQRFAVNTCLQDARGERRRVLDRLAREQAVLDDTQRRQRAAERLRGIEDKTRQADERSVAPPPLRRVQRQPPLAPARPAVPASAPPVIDSLAADQDGARQAARNRQDHARRLQEAEAHRDAVRRRNAAQDAKKPPAAPLPVPSAPTNGRR